MPLVESISDAVFQDTLSRAVQDVFSTMLGKSAVLRESKQELIHAEQVDALELKGAQIVGTVGFIGEITGLIYLYLEIPFAEEVSCGLLDMEPAELAECEDEVVNDAIGELTNMTVGAFKNQLCDVGFPCKLTIPSILRGSNFTIEPVRSAARRIYHFDVGGHTLVADLLMKQGE
ncbi:chemotaxis protein CheX [Actomonas aquatica]|uniref:Chemotaxis protein CheX n=1 Tax=Actomonas aquatica TaxID=2866162 RepID=A0ABZ1CCG0_9BACT|nr:chemotaxis protein CheX [Opitutus sp. WL0086]WRQ89335.1 chemotaxis protein CheX [Opitutus sp. WL0086]